MTWRRFVHTQEDKNILLLSIEVFFTSIMTVAQSFFQLFAVRLGATNTEIGLLTSVPALLIVFLSFPVGRFLSSRQKPRQWVLGGIVANRAVLILLVLVPLVNWMGVSQGEIVVAILILSGIPILFFNIGFSPFVMRLISGDRWVNMFSLRNMISLLTTATGVALLGSWLNGSRFPFNYQVTILVALPVSLVGLIFWQGTRDSHPVQSLPHSTSSSTFSGLFKTFEMLNFHQDLGRVIINQLLQYAGLWMATPLYVIYTLKSLGANEKWVGTNTMIVSICALLGSLFARWAIHKYGEPAILRRFSQVDSLLPIMMGISTSLTPILAVYGLNSFFRQAYSLSHNANMLGSFPSGKEHDGVAIYNILTSSGGFVFALIGVALAYQLGIRQVLVGCGVLSFIGSLSFWVWPVKGEWKLRLSLQEINNG